MCSNMGSGGAGSGAGGGGMGGSPGTPPYVVDTKDMVSERETKQREVDDVLTVSKFVADTYGKDAVIEQFQIATLKGKSQDNVIGYYDGANIAMNEKFFNGKGLDTVYDDCVRSGFHPSRGKKSGVEAVAAHEYGHALTAVAATRMGESNYMKAAARIVKDAKKDAGHSRSGDLARAISGYAKHNYAETIAEAFADVYCNSKKAKRESQAVVASMNRYLP